MDHTFITSANLQVEGSPWGPHEWLSRPGQTAAEHLLMVRVLMPYVREPDRCTFNLSPRAFTVSTEMRIAAPGKSASHGSVAIVACAWYSMFPQLAVGG